MTAGGCAGSHYNSPRPHKDTAFYLPLSESEHLNPVHNLEERADIVLVHRK